MDYVTSIRKIMTQRNKLINLIIPQPKFLRGTRKEYAVDHSSVEVEKINVEAVKLWRSVQPPISIILVLSKVTEQEP